MSTQISILWWNAQNDSHLSTMRRSHKVCHTPSHNITISFKNLPNYEAEFSIVIFGRMEYFLAQCGMARALAQLLTQKSENLIAFQQTWITHSYDYNSLEKGISSFQCLLSIDALHFLATLIQTPLVDSWTILNQSLQIDYYPLVWEHLDSDFDDIKLLRLTKKTQKCKKVK